MRLLQEHVARRDDSLEVKLYVQLSRLRMRQQLLMNGLALNVRRHEGRAKNWCAAVLIAIGVGVKVALKGTEGEFRPLKASFERLS